MKKFEFSWSRFLSVAMCGAMLLFAGCEEMIVDPDDNGDDPNVETPVNPDEENPGEENPGEENPGEDTPVEPEGVFAIEFSNITDTDATVTVTGPEGAEKFYFYAEAYDAEYYDMEYSLSWMIESIEFNPDDNDLLVDNPYSTSLKDCIFWGIMDVAPGDYIVMVAPYENPTVDNIEYKIYHHEGAEPINYTLGDTAADAILTQESNAPSYVNINVALTEGAQYFYDFILEENWGDGMTDEAVLEYLDVANRTPSDNAMIIYDGNPGTEVRLLVYVFDSNYVGKVVTATFSTTGLEFSETASITGATVNSVGLADANVTLTVTGNITQLLYLYYLKSEVDSAPEFYGPDAVESNLAQYRDMSGTPVEAVSGHTYTFQLDKMKDQVVYVMGIDDNNLPTHIYSFNVNTEAAFKFNSSAVLPTVAAVSYCFELAYDENYNYDYVNSVWTNMNTVTSSDVFMDTMGEWTNCKYGAFKFDIDWGSITPVNVWVMGEDVLDYNPFIEVAMQDAIKVVTLGNSTVNPEAAYSSFGMTRMAKYDENFNATYSPMSFYIVYEDANGVSPYFKVTPEDYIGK